MATVQERSRNTPLDKKYAHPNRTNAGSPIGALVPLYANEMVFDTTNFRYYKAIGLTNNDWLYVVKTEGF
jgi:hypothetical protein